METKYVDEVGSGFHRIADNRGLLVKFGGGIQFWEKWEKLAKNRYHAILEMRELKNKLNTADEIPENSETLPFVVALYFDDVRSVDMMIEALNHVKDAMTSNKDYE